MLIEYKIKFEEDGLTITQRVEPDASDSAPVARTAQTGGLTGRSLGSAFEAGEGGGPEDRIGPGGGPGDPIGPGGEGPGARPIIILGPIIVGAPSRKQAASTAAVETSKDSYPEKIVHRRSRE